MDSVVAVVGPGGHDVDPELLAAARQVGRGLAEGGATVLCGGLDGVMSAAAEGARSAGGMTIGVLPGTDRAAANPHILVALPTGLGEARNAIIARSADVLVAVGGGYGTLSEIAFALKAGTPVIGYRTWVLHREDVPDPGIVVVESAQEAVRRALAGG